MAIELEASPAQDTAPHRLRRRVLCVSMCVAALANALIPAVFFSETHLFGQTDPRYRATVAFVVLVEYAIALALILFHANVGFAAGYAAATATIVTLGSAALAYITLAPAGWGWSALYTEIVVVAGLAFAVLSNLAFLVASIRYGRAICPRLHVGGFFLGVGASLALLLIYVKVLS